MIKHHVFINVIGMPGTTRMANRMSYLNVINFNPALAYV